MKKTDFFAEFTGHTIGLVAQIAIIVLFGLIFLLLSRVLIKLIFNFVNVAEKEMQNRPASDLIWGTVGLVAGIFIAYLISIPIYRLDLPVIGSLLSLLVYMILGYLGIRIMMRKRGEITTAVKEINLPGFSGEKKALKNNIRAVPKVLDTSVIIDGRVVEIEKIGFLEGPLLIPISVLHELQHIADSSDSLKRTRGRRGLDSVKRMQEEGNSEIVISEETYDDIPEVDSKIMKLAQDVNGVIVTNDYNLNKVASVQGIQVLNINELSNAVKPVVIPGESMAITIVKEGNQAKQGLAYLDDGTMVVVENGYDLIGETVDCLVTSVLQTAAGKMIFAKPKEQEND
ncbi:PIN domain-containing protein [Peptoniphilus sp. KCTC 25270]|uniref:PIN/TRAM domain-containing protein n=1 Tax=Peptoniphilus sp. KCTC 25270 TaxID=2897414 RepID=UPI001E3BE7A1|nr:PIN domain-containing protein [Peptoniphilus sp. KCTC 25270]MCD1146778.1 PIN domain-containing protein [Peptoniphilus sp. KCTC 25270]